MFSDDQNRRFSDYMKATLKNCHIHVLVVGHIYRTRSTHKVRPKATRGRTRPVSHSADSLPARSCTNHQARPHRSRDTDAFMTASNQASEHNQNATIRLSLRLPVVLAAITSEIERASDFGHQNHLQSHRLQQSLRRVRQKLRDKTRQ